MNANTVEIKETCCTNINNMVTSNISINANIIGSLMLTTDKVPSPTQGRDHPSQDFDVGLWTRKTEALRELDVFYRHSIINYCLNVERNIFLLLEIFIWCIDEFPKRKFEPLIARSSLHPSKVELHLDGPSSGESPGLRSWFLPTDDPWT